MNSVVAALPGRQLKCSNFLGMKKERGKRNGRKEKEEKELKEGNETTERKKDWDRMGPHLGKEE